MSLKRLVHDISTRVIEEESESVPASQRQSESRVSQLKSVRETEPLADAENRDKPVPMHQQENEIKLNFGRMEQAKESIVIMD